MESVVEHLSESIHDCHEWWHWTLTTPWLEPDMQCTIENEDAVVGMQVMKSCALAKLRRWS